MQLWHSPRPQLSLFYDASSVRWIYSASPFFCFELRRGSWNRENNPPTHFGKQPLKYCSSRCSSRAFVYKCKVVDWERRFDSRGEIPSALAAWGFSKEEVSTGARESIKARCFLWTDMGAAWGGGGIPLESARLIIPSDWTPRLWLPSERPGAKRREERGRRSLLGADGGSSLGEPEPGFQLFKGALLTLMCFQSNTCNYLVWGALQVVILKEPFDRGKSLI